MTNLYAQLVNKDCGYDHDKEKVKKYNLGSVFEVKDVSVGQSSSTVKLVGEDGYFNSVHFRYFDTNGEVNIYERYSPYRGRGCTE